MDIKEFLLARIAEDEAAAGAKPVVDLPVTRVHHPHSIEEVPGYVLPMTIETFAHDRLEAGTMEASFTPNPARVLRECAAKRTIVAYFELEAEKMADPRKRQAASEPEWWLMRAAERTLHSLAAVYSDHPDYQPEWAA